MQALERRVARALDALLRDELDREAVPTGVSAAEREAFGVGSPLPRDRERARARWPIRPLLRLQVTLEVLVGVALWRLGIVRGLLADEDLHEEIRRKRDREAERALEELADDLEDD